MPMPNQINHQFSMPYGGQGMSSPGLWNMPDQAYQYNGGRSQDYNPQGYMGGFTGGGSNAGMVNALRTYGQYQQMPGQGSPSQFGMNGGGGSGMGQRPQMPGSLDMAAVRAQQAQREQQLQQYGGRGPQDAQQQGAAGGAPPPGRAPGAGESSWGDAYGRMRAANPMGPQGNPMEMQSRQMEMNSAQQGGAGNDISGLAEQARATYGSAPQQMQTAAQQAQLGAGSAAVAPTNTYAPQPGAGALGRTATGGGGHALGGGGQAYLARAARQRAGQGQYQQAMQNFGAGQQITDPNMMRLMQGTGG